MGYVSGTQEALGGQKSIQVCMSAEWKKLNSGIRKNITICLLLSGYEDFK